MFVGSPAPLVQEVHALKQLSSRRLKKAPSQYSEQWLNIVKESHKVRPLLEVDQRNLRRALEVYGERTDWLDEKPESDDAESKADESESNA
ncbi:MAG: hypothetical protein SGPRY_001068 [Prymnesium sp.]